MSQLSKDKAENVEQQRRDDNKRTETSASEHDALDSGNQGGDSGR
jgi:hypothetical protein